MVKEERLGADEQNIPTGVALGPTILQAMKHPFSLIALIRVEITRRDFRVSLLTALELSSLNSDSKRPRGGGDIVVRTLRRRAT